MSIDRGMDKEAVVHIYNGILRSHKKNEVMPFIATWMDLEIIILSEESQPEKDEYISLVCGISNMTRMNLSTKQEQIHRHREQASCCLWGGE